MSEEIDELAAALHKQHEKSAHSSKKPWYRTRWFKISLPIIAIIVLSFGVLAVLALTHKQDPNQAALQKIGKNVSFPLYYPSKLPTYFFMDTGSVDTNNGVVIFTVNRNDQQKIFVSEQSLPQGFNASQVTGKKVTIPNVGTMTIGTGFQGYRAVIEAKGTLIFVSSSKKITAHEFANVAKSFQPV